MAAGLPDSDVTKRSGIDIVCTVLAVGPRPRDRKRRNPLEWWVRVHGEHAATRMDKVRGLRWPHRGDYRRVRLDQTGTELRLPHRHAVGGARYVALSGRIS